MSALEEVFAAQIIALEIDGGCVREYVFARPRRYRFDFAWPELMIAIEIEGGVWARGRHSRGKGFLEDCQKYNLAAGLGWRVLRGEVKMVESGELAESARLVILGRNCETMRTNYRLLAQGEVIGRGDEFLSDDCLTWTSVPIDGGDAVWQRWMIGIPWNPLVNVPFRRVAMDKFIKDKEE